MTSTGAPGGSMPDGEPTSDPRLTPGVCRAIVDASPDGVLVTDAAGLIAYVNPRLEAMSGYAGTDLVGRPVETLVPDEFREHHTDLHRAYRSAPRPRLVGEGTDLRLRRRDGSVGYVEIALAPIRLEGRTLTIAAVRDSSQRHALEAERMRLIQMLDLVPDAIVVADAATLEIEYANPAMTALLGYAPEELVGSPLTRVRPDSLAPDRPSGAAASPPWPPAPFADFVLVGRSGERLPVEIHQRLVAAEDGPGHLVAVARDLSERREQQERLRTSEKSFRTAFELAPVGVEVVALPPDGTRSIVLANHALATMFACPVQDLIGRSLDEFTFPEDSGHAAPTVPARVPEGRTSVVHRRRYRREDGTELWADVHATRLEVPGVQGPAALVQLVDVTDEVGREAQRQREALLSAYVAQVATTVLEDPLVPGLHQDLALRAAALLEGEGALLVLRDDPRDGATRIAAVTGDLTAPVTDGRISAHDLVDSPLFPSAPTVFTTPPDGTPRPWTSTVGPVAAAPVGDGDGEPEGVLLVLGAPGRRPFTADDLDRLTRFAAQTRLALRLADARADQQRLALLEDRQRIARDLHDTVIQDVIGVGMQIAADAELDEDPRRRAGNLDRVAQLEEAVHRLRRIVFELRAGPPRAPLSRAVRELAAEASRLLGHEPEVLLDGDADSLHPAIAADVASVLREALSNIIRHADAAHTTVALRVTHDAVVLRVEDDGRGIPTAPSRGYGIENIEHRAAARRGSVHFTTSAGGGTRLLWSCPLGRPAPDPPT